MEIYRCPLVSAVDLFPQSTLIIASVMDEYKISRRLNEACVHNDKTLYTGSATFANNV
jgi:hypothetical protein